MAASILWHFAKPGLAARQRNSKLDEHFAGSGTDRAGDLVREGGQNSMDARAKDAGGPVRVRIAFGSLDRDSALKYAAGLQEHAKSIRQQRARDRVAAAIEQEQCEYLLFEDFNTTGLTGSPEQLRRYDNEEPNSFHTFFRAEGQTDKVDATKQGSKGVGKVTFMAASRARAVLGLTTRHDKRTLLFGTAVLHTHRHGDEDYDGDAWYGRQRENEGVMPVEDAGAVAAFREDFELSRQDGEPGLSVVVPWLETHVEDGLTADRVIDAILRSHVWPILQGRLAVEVVTAAGASVGIDATHFLSVLDARQDEALNRHVRPLAELGSWALSHRPDAAADRLGVHGPTAPKWDDAGILAPEQRDRLRAAFDAGDRIAVRVPIRIRPKGNGPAEVDSYFDLFLQKDRDAATSAGPTVHFVRGGLLIAGMSRRVSGIRGLIVAEDQGVAGFLRDAENPSHTKWNAKPIKDDYTYAPSTLKFVLDAAKGLAALLAGDAAESEPVWLDKLSVTGGEATGGANGTGPKHRRKKTPPKPPPPIGPIKPVKKRPYTIEVVSGGFAVGPSGKPFETPMPARLELRLAYHVRGRNPLTRWHRNDFDLQRKAAFPVEHAGCELEEREPNRLLMRIDDPDGFKFTMTGFDTRRELFCKPRLIREDGVDEGGDDDEGEEPALTGAASEGSDA